MCAVLFKPTALDLNGGPRMMTVVVPFPREFDQRLGLANADPGACCSAHGTSWEANRTSLDSLSLTPGEMMGTSWEANRTSLDSLSL